MRRCILRVSPRFAILPTAFLAALLLAPSAAGQADTPDKRASPYDNWKIHVGTPADAVVHVRVSLVNVATGELQVREGSGFVARCDGFIVVPAPLVSRTMTLASGETRRVPTQDKKTELTFVAADGPIPPPQSVRHPAFFNDDLDFAVVKVNDVHFKGLQMLSPRSVKEGMAVRVVYAALAKDTPGRAEPVSVHATVGKARAEGKRWSFAGEGPRVPPGAVVVEAVSGLAIGMVPGGAVPAEKNAPVSPAPEFAPFADVAKISNVVALLPSAAAKAPDPLPEPGTEKDGMVWIPGGPTTLPGALAREYQSLYGAKIACTPGFWIDKRAVSNGEYHGFLDAKSFPEWPAGWRYADGSEVPRTPDLPVTGVTPEAAAAYADAADKRLVTPVEWVRATAEPAGLTWLQQYFATRELAHQAIQERLAELLPPILAPQQSPTRQPVPRGAVQKMPLLPGRTVDVDRGTPVTRAPYTVKLVIPMVMGGDVPASLSYGVRAGHRERVLDAEQMADLFGLIDQIVQQVEEQFSHPFLLAPVGKREQDATRWGVRDVLENGNELLLPNPAQRRWEVAAKVPSLDGHRFVPLAMDPDAMPQWYPLRAFDYCWVTAVPLGVVGADGLPLGPGPKNLPPATRSGPSQWNLVWNPDAKRLFDARRVVCDTLYGFRCAR